MPRPVRLDVSSPISLMLNLDVKNLIITKGANGADLYMWSEETRFITKKSHKPKKLSGSPDVTGCGDVLDISFCYNWAIGGLTLVEALKAASDRATEFAYEPIEARIKCH